MRKAHLTRCTKLEPRRKKDMASWFERQASSHHVQLGAVAVLSGLAVAGTILGTQAIRREKRIGELKASIPELSESHHADVVPNMSAIMRYRY